MCIYDINLQKKGVVFMVVDMGYWAKVSKRILMLIISIICIILAFKCAVFYMPFLIAVIISLMIEPLIKFVNKKTKLTRKTSAIIVLIIVFAIIIGLLAWGITSLISEASNLLNGLNDYYEKAYIEVQNIINSVDFDKINISEDVTNILKNSTGDFLKTISNWITNALHSLMNVITSIPTIAIYVVVTLLAIYFICTDRLYILDQIEHHLPKLWVKKMGKHFRELVTTLGNYLKAEATLILIDFIIVIIGLFLYKLFGFNIEYPLLSALGIAFVDALPILGAGTAMVPWAVVCAINGDIKLAIAILILYAIILILRQFLEPKIVSNHIGIHPIFTLIAMYTGFKFMGIMGMLIGPIILIILKNIFSTLIDQGFVKTILDTK